MCSNLTDTFSVSTRKACTMKAWHLATGNRNAIHYTWFSTRRRRYEFIYVQHTKNPVTWTTRTRGSSLAGNGLQAIHTTIIVFPLSPHRTQQLYRKEFLHSPGHLQCSGLRYSAGQSSAGSPLGSGRSSPDDWVNLIRRSNRLFFVVWRYSVWGSATVPAICSDGNVLVKTAGTKRKQQPG
jgi:hypothetical protein